MRSTASNLLTAVVEALPGYLEERIIALGLDPAAFVGVLEAAAGSARVGLADLLARPYDRQTESPLEVVRRSVTVVTAALQAMGVGAPARDAEEERVAPDDPYSLGPVSAGDLGDAALQASLRWGVAKTEALSRPTLLVVTSNLIDSTRFDAAAASAGYRVEASRDGSATATPLVAFVDIESRTGDDAIRTLAASGVKVVAYGPHVDEMGMMRALSLGASAAEPRSRMFRNPAEYLPPLV
jgi:hypothetical protein